MTDPYMLGFYVGMATATVLEMGAILITFAAFRKHRSDHPREPRDEKDCQECGAELDDTGTPAGHYLDLFVCVSCGDTVPRRHSKRGMVPIFDIISAVAVEEATNRGECECNLFPGKHLANPCRPFPEPSCESCGSGSVASPDAMLICKDCVTILERACVAESELERHRVGS